MINTTKDITWQMLMKCSSIRGNFNRLAECNTDVDGEYN